MMTKKISSIGLIISAILIYSIQVAHCDDFNDRETELDDGLNEFRSSGTNIAVIVAPIVSILIVIAVCLLCCKLCCGSRTRVTGAVIAIPQSQQQQQQQVSQIIINPMTQYPSQQGMQYPPQQGMQPGPQYPPQHGMQPGPQYPPQHGMQPGPQYPPPPPQYSEQQPTYQNPNDHKQGFTNPTYQPDRDDTTSSNHY